MLGVRAMGQCIETPSTRGIAPVFVSGNPTLCTGGLRIEDTETKTYSFFDGYVVINIQVNEDKTLSWSTTSAIVIESVIVKGADNANLYAYAGTGYKDDGNLHAPCKNNSFGGLSHIDFCYHYTLNVSKTVVPAFTRTYNWDITKSVTPASWNLFDGDSGTSQYTVSVDKKDYADSDWAVSGTITIHNPSPIPAPITGVTDAMGDVMVLMNCGVTFPYTLAPGASLSCSYSAALPNGDDRTNTVMVATSSTAIVGASYSAPVDFDNAVIAEVNPAIHVTDTYGGDLGMVSDDATFTYTRTFNCGDDAGAYDNTATIVETGESASASVTVTCNKLSVSKTATTEMKRMYTWTIDKSCSPEETVFLAPGETSTASYTVTVNAGYEDSGWKVSGQISIHNPATIPAVINSLADVVSPAINAEITGCTFPYTLAGGATLTCGYTAELTNDASRTNTATIAQQNFDYNHLMVATANGTTNYSGNADVIFGPQSIEHVDECITVSDAGDLGTVCYGVDPLPKTFTYTRTIGPYTDCGPYTVENTASFVTNDRQLSDSDGCDIEVIVPCELTISKTANTFLTRTYDWTIDKTVTPAEWNLLEGDQGTSLYTVSVKKTGFNDSGWRVEGIVTIVNKNPYPALINSISDAVGAIPVTLTCPVGFPYELAAGGTLTCTYTQDLPDVTPLTNTVTVVSGTPMFLNGTATADVDFGSATITKVHEKVSVTDTNDGQSWGPVTGDDEWTYERTFTCDADEGHHPNTATIYYVNEGQYGPSASAAVDVKCYNLQIVETARTGMTESFTWLITKTASESELELSVGQIYTGVGYTVVVSATDAFSDWRAAGEITISNPTPVPAVINCVTDVVSPDLSAGCNCGVTFPFTLDPGASLTCTYALDLPDAASRMSTGTAQQQCFSYDHDMSATPIGVMNYSANAGIDFSSAEMHYVDECVDVSDTYAGFLGRVCAGDNREFTFTYTRDIGPYDVCGTYEVENVAGFVTNDNGYTGSAEWTIDIDVPCGGCTLTPGYWKTHSERGPAPYDDTWAMLADGASTPFFLSGLTYYVVLWTPPSGGNAYYILAHAYIAAQLNVLNGVSIPADVQAAFNAATTLFNTKTPAQVAALKGKPRNDILALATLLDNYNNGLVGPGHCSEETDTDKALTMPSDNAQAEATQLKDGLRLAQNTPNPFSGVTTFAFTLPEPTKVKLSVYSLNGQLVATVLDNFLDAGEYRIDWNMPEYLSAGIYVYRLQTEWTILTKKMTFLR